jgi:hypothetical protein
VSAGAVYVGRLWAVTLGGGRFVEVAPCSLGVIEGVGLVLGHNRRELARGVVFARPRGRRAQVLETLWYRRRRPSGDLWFHHLPEATAVLDGDDRNGRPFVWIRSVGSIACGAEDFVCN